MNGEKKSQADKFKDAAHQVGADDDDKRFEEKLKDLVKQKPGSEEPNKG
ncbi:hypothetical protein [Ruegeria atlantica]|nr:hypothetical protein [Ruegeria atlantica]